jgi:hypothetical protein
MNKGEKKTTQKMPFIIVNGGFYNGKITLKGVVTKQKKELWGIKRIDEKYELRQSSTYNMQPYNITLWETMLKTLAMSTYNTTQLG